jgi:nucleotide-binding universal stress UspA family protein
VHDGSSVSDRALAVACERARERGATVTVLAVIPPRLWRARRGQMPIPADRHDEEFARAVIARAKEACRAAGVRAEGRIRSGPVGAVVSEEAARGYVALVIGARRNRAGAPSLARLVTLPEGCELVSVE